MPLKLPTAAFSDYGIFVGRAFREGEVDFPDPKAG